MYHPGAQDPSNEPSPRLPMGAEMVAFLESVLSELDCLDC